MYLHQNRTGAGILAGNIMTWFELLKESDDNLDWVYKLPLDLQWKIIQVKSRGGLTKKHPGIFTTNDGREFGSGPNGEVTEQDLISSGRRRMVDRIKEEKRLEEE